jgi:hypothetical protein
LTVLSLRRVAPITGAINPYPSSDKRIFGGGVYGSPP